jgi:hypothetical protein
MVLMRSKTNTVPIWKTTWLSGCYLASESNNYDRRFMRTSLPFGEISIDQKPANPIEMHVFEVPQ